MKYCCITCDKNLRNLTRLESHLSDGEIHRITTN